MSGEKETEREFMHRLSTPLSTAMISLDALQEELTGLGGQPCPGETTLFHVDQARQALERIHELVRERRSMLRAST